MSRGAFLDTVDLRARALAFLPVLILVFAFPSIASAEGDPVRGAKLAYTCMGCHGIPNYKNTYPMYSVPKLAGQSADYIVAALTGYKDGMRGHGTMHSQAATMSDQDMQDIAAYLAGSATIQRNPNARADGAPKAAQQLCVSCHGADGVAIAPAYPNLAGQYPDYLEQALHEYKAGSRKNPVMGTFAAQLKDEEIRDLARYFSEQRPGLGTPKPLH
jgi:cytochrome c553